MKSLIGGLGGLINQAPPYVSRRGGLSLPMRARNDPEAQMRAMGGVGTLFAIVHRTSEATSQVRWRLYCSSDTGDDEDRTEVTRHAALDTWRKPNQFMTQQELVESTQQHVDLTGEGWLVIGRNPAMRSIPLELWPVRPDRIAPVPSSTDFLAGYVYFGPDGEQVPLMLDEVIQLRVPNPLDPYRGMGAVQSILTDLDSAKYSAEWSRNFFINSAEPGGIVEVDRRLSDDEFNEMRERWNEQHRGVAAAHRVAVLEQGKWVDRKYSMRDMQFTELRQATSEVIREAFGFPKPLLGSVDNVNRANAEAGEVMFARWLIVPRLERIKQALNNDFLPMFGTAGQGLEFDYDNPVPDDVETENAQLLARTQSAKYLVDAGYDRSDVLKTVELPDMAFTVPVPPPAPLIAPPAPTPDQPPVPTQRRATRNAASPAHDVDLTQVQAAWEHALENLLTQWHGVLETQTTQLAGQITETINAGNLEQLANMHANSDHGAALLAAAMQALASASAGHVVDEAAAQGAAIRPVTADHSTLATAAATVAALLAAALAVAAGREALRIHRPGASGHDVADQVTEHLRATGDSEQRRALGGALTGAQNAARIATLKAAPEAALYASEQMDGNTCTPCREVDGRWLANTDGTDFNQLDKSYPFGGYVGCLGRDRCRGTVVGVWRPEQTEG